MKHLKDSSKKLKLISDRDFYKLWKSANEETKSYDFITKNRDWPYKKYCLTYDEFSTLLRRIYNSAHLSFKEILDLKKITKAKVSNLFCIPIRTVEDWYSGINKCPAYIRLLLLRYFKIMYLGKYIKIEGVYNYDTSIPRTYEKKEELKEEPKKKFSLEELEEEYGTSALLKKTDYLKDIINRKTE